jgi:hypothetical protein
MRKIPWEQYLHMGNPGRQRNHACYPKGNWVKISQTRMWRLTVTLGSPETWVGASGRVIFST